MENSLDWGEKTDCIPYNTYMIRKSTCTYFIWTGHHKIQNWSILSATSLKLALSTYLLTGNSETWPRFGSLQLAYMIDWGWLRFEVQVSSTHWLQNKTVKTVDKISCRFHWCRKKHINVFATLIPGGVYVYWLQIHDTGYDRNQLWSKARYLHMGRFFLSGKQA